MKISPLFNIVRRRSSSTVRKMYTDVPRFNRCCFCFPLRYSLLVWGCFTLGLNLFQVYVMADTLYHILNNRSSEDNPIVQAENFMIALCLSEVVARSLYVIVALVLIIAALKKHVKLFRFVYYCCIADLVFLFVYGIYIISMTIHIKVSIIPMSANSILRNTIRDIIMTAGAILIEGYTMLLIRSELYKLRERSKIQFTNSAAEAQVVVETLEQN